MPETTELHATAADKPILKGIGLGLAQNLPGIGLGRRVG